MSEGVRPGGTYKTLAEQREVLTPAEERFEVARQTIGSLAAVAAVSALIAIIISETTSNTASATIVVPIVIPIANAAGLDPLVPALAAVFGASFGFMMPVSTPQNAVVYGSGMIPITKMVRSGLVFDIIGLILIVLLIPVMAGLILA